ncbi:N-acyl-D-amino-acid deacylase family protein [Bordetella hinzii]|uniref:D-aminoacylase n=1 Tax=Bordetella hinzii TaxID=103855 RepID=A0AAN1S176_9BORD|nr:D-aminoacylase [Bordetella hinzii]AKQ59561.1 D-aminoacylase [Bordetella hinzii]AZW19298.1 D-aminoacylase [Bordetella hinzii]KCB50590.1 N-acyl-D-amino-acid deacylase [Bordetella hinzii 1277]MBZ0073742.1 D-aminoacylase [Bordetella hinzii]MBZ0077782.1 D-aminoacylase [Bordetella hinzii]
MSQVHDLLIRGAEIIDGSGAPRFAGDLAVDGERITRLGDLSGHSGRREIDAAGRVLAPGFIDAHTHDDRAMLSDGDMAPKVSQGVTTVIGGNCGISLAPRPPRVVPPLDLLDSDGQWFRYARYADYMQALRDQPAATNCAMLLGHITLRVAAVPDLAREARPAEIAAMREQVERALEAGAIGVSTGLAYAPSRAASTEEIIEVCRPLRDHGGIFTTHLRDEGDAIMDCLEETFRIGRELDVPVVISHHKVVGRPNYGRSAQTLARIGEQMRRQPICLDCYPYNASSTILEQELVDGAARVIVTWSKASPQYAGRDLDDVAREMGCAVPEAVRRLQPAGAIYFRMHEEDVARILRFDDTMIGSDGLPHDEMPHPRLWGSFPRVLGHYARGLGLFPLEKAVHKMTGLTAARFGLADRGVLREGAYADLVLLDALRVEDRATFAHPVAPAAGIDAVWTNGRPVWQDGKTTGERPGRVLRRQA